MMKRFALISVLILLALVIGYFAMQSAFSGPMYKPGDLTSKADYAHLLDTSPSDGRANYFAISEDISLYFFRKGKGEAILVLHGGPGIPSMTGWAGLDSVKGNYDFVYYHQRGCGNSTRPIDSFSSKNMYKNLQALNVQLGLPAQVADIEQIRKKLGVEKITLVGHSFGGFLASLYAIEFPKRVKGLVLITPADVIKIPSDQGGLYEVVREKLPQEEVAAYDEYMERFFDFGSLFEKSEEDLVNLNQEFVPFYRMAAGESAGNFGEVKGMGGWIQQAVFISMGKKHDYSEHYQKIQAPTLVIHGEDDLIPESSLQIYLDKIPDVELKLIPKASHASFEDQPKEFARIIEGFLGRL